MINYRFKEITEDIKATMRSRNFTETDLANYLGVSQAYVNACFNSGRGFPMDSTKKLCLLLDIYLTDKDIVLMELEKKHDRVSKWVNSGQKTILALEKELKKRQY